MPGYGYKGVVPNSESLFSQHAIWEPTNQKVSKMKTCITI